MLKFKTVSLKITVGVLIVFLGSMMVVTPHQFSSPVYDALRPFLSFLGIPFLLTGMAVLAVLQLRPPRWAVMAIHILAGGELLVLAYSQAPIGGWTGAINFGILGLGTVVGGFLPRFPETRRQQALDYLFATGSHHGRDMDEMPAVVLLDLKLPKIDGLEVLGRLRSNGRSRLLPVVILTSSSEEKDMIAAYSLGANSYIRKPVNFDDFSEVLSHLAHYWLRLNQAPPVSGTR